MPIAADFDNGELFIWKTDKYLVTQEIAENASTDEMKVKRVAYFRGNVWFPVPEEHQFEENFNPYCKVEDAT